VNPLGLAFFILYWVVFVYSIVLHELAHGWVAFKLGDPTAMKAGRLSLNPIRHIDPFFSILMPILFFISTGVPFGGAKPVPVNPYLYKNMRWGSMLDAAAGPLTNLLIACFCAVGLTISRITAGTEQYADLRLTGQFFGACLLFNVFIAAFNMLPVPPLDGSHVLGALLPRSLSAGWEKLRALGWWPLIILVLSNRFSGGLTLTVPLALITGLILHSMGLVSNTDEFLQLLKFFSPMRLLDGE
jgi:Zn-dependent protease